MATKSANTTSGQYEAQAIATFKASYQKLGLPTAVGTVMAQSVYARVCAKSFAPFREAITPAATKDSAGNVIPAVVPSIERTLYELLLGVGNPSALGAKLLSDGFLTKAGVVSFDNSF